MIVGYEITGPDNDSFMLGGPQKSSTPLCPKCGYLSDFNYHNSLFRLRRKVYDFSNCYDFASIVSLKFREFCHRQHYEGVMFKEFEKEPDFFQLIVLNEVEFDTAKAKTGFSKPCEACGNYEEVIGTDPIFLKNIKAPLSDGFYRTTLLFGSENSKCPIFVVAPETRQKLLTEKMRGLLFEPIEG